MADKQEEQREMQNLAAAGYTGRSGNIFTATYERDQQNKIGNERKKEQSKLEALLMDMHYKAAYDAAMDAYEQAQSAVYEALIKANHELSHSKQLHNQTLDNASTYGDIRVFMDLNSNVYTEDDRQLTDDEILDVDWREDAPSRETYLQSREDLQQKQKRVDDVSGHQKRLDSINSELNNEESPPSRERLDELKDELNGITHSVQNENHKSDYSAKHINVENVPDLQL